jgi:hypothetical protein
VCFDNFKLYKNSKKRKENMSFSKDLPDEAGKDMETGNCELERNR